MLCRTTARWLQVPDTLSCMQRKQKRPGRWVWITDLGFGVVILLNLLATPQPLPQPFPAAVVTCAFGFALSVWLFWIELNADPKRVALMRKLNPYGFQFVGVAIRWLVCAGWLIGAFVFVYWHLSETNPHAFNEV